MRDQSWPSVNQMLAMSDEELARVDPLVMNLVVATGIPSLADLDIGHYVALADSWAAAIQHQIPAAKANFRRTPGRWQNDRDFALLALMCWYVGKVIGIEYNEDQRQPQRIRYTNPGDLFLNGVIDTRQGTCGNTAALYVVLGWRLGWPVSLACVQSHYVCRYGDGRKVFNLEATFSDEGGSFSSPPDSYYIDQYRIPQCALDCGSDLRAVTPREMLGLFLGLRARHLDNTERMKEAEPDYLLARHLFPRNRQLYFEQNQCSVQCSMDLFEPGERAHPTELAVWLQEVVRVAPWKRKAGLKWDKEPKEKLNGRAVDLLYQSTLVVGGVTLRGRRS